MHTKKPDWLKVKIHGSEALNEVYNMLRQLSLHTVCEEANCPNIMECFSKKTATLMILGNICTRNCTFCAVSKGRPQPPDQEEPVHVAQAVATLNLQHVVITSVTRDDLTDGGAGQFAMVIEKLHELNQHVIVEVLIPDLKGDPAALSQIIKAKPKIINHNIETIPRLYPEVRPMAVYQRSLGLLKNVKLSNADILTKSGFMVGLGEKTEEVIQLMRDLRNTNCDILTIGQYLAPSPSHHPVIEYIHPDIFERYRQTALQLGFRHVASGPLVRSSYHANQMI